MSRHTALFLSLLCAALCLVGYRLADSYIDRLPNHAGYYLVSVADPTPPPQLAGVRRPRHTVLVVIDGLRADYAVAMQSVRRLRQSGQCLLTNVGPETVSRPVYAVISTGLEQDRTGSRNNDDTSPLHVESIWQVARQSGLTVSGVSELPWFHQLFPDGFDRFRLLPRADDHFTTPESALGDLTLIHPIYVDENGHSFGGKSREYAEAAARADQELGRLLDRVDLSRDLIVFTADHGHTDRGGHGAPTPDVGRVLTCFAGHGVARREPPDSATPAPTLPAERFDSRLIAPSLAVLLGLRFPKNMRAGEDSLDTIWELVDPSSYSAEYLASRRAAIANFRAGNRIAVGHWLGRTEPAEWSELYAHGRRWQLLRALLVFAAALLLWRVAPRSALPERPTQFALWILATLMLLVVVWSVARGSFDFNSVNARAEFVRWASLCSLATGVVAMGAHFLLHRSLAALAIAQVQLVLVVLLINLAHIAAFGWPLGFPIPGRILLFLPFLSGAFLCFEAALGLLACLLAAGFPTRAQR